MHTLEETMNLTSSSAERTYLIYILKQIDVLLTREQLVCRVLCKKTWQRSFAYCSNPISCVMWSALLAICTFHFQPAWKAGPTVYRTINETVRIAVLFKCFSNSVWLKAKETFIAVRMKIWLTKPVYSLK